MNNDSKKIIEFLFKNYNIDISVYDKSFLNKCLHKRIEITNSNLIDGYYEYLLENKNEVTYFLDSLNIAVSEFFRNTLTFSFIEQVILPLLIEKKKRNNENEIRIWSAACAAGQETYSIAIILDEVIEKLKLNINYRIFATDINMKNLTLARNGIYQEAYLNKVTYHRVKKYFSYQDDYFTIIPKMKNNIDFSIFDLIENKNNCPSASIYGSFDIVLCSNILFYYNDENRQIILEKIKNCLAPDGYIITGETEREILKINNFKEILPESSIFQINNKLGTL
jgi:chemotaxis protein methyltransferase CheR